MARKAEIKSLFYITHVENVLSESHLLGGG